MPPGGAGEGACATSVSFGSEEQAPGRGLVGQLPAELGGEPDATFPIREGGMRREAMEHEDVASLIVGRDPAGFEAVESPVADSARVLATGLDGESTKRARDFAERHPA